MESPQSLDLEGFGDGVLVNSGFQKKTRNGVCNSGSSLVLDCERGELVETSVRVERKGVSVERSVAALRNHSEAERKRRARINGHLDTLRGLIPGAKKMDKASLLAAVVSRLKELKREAAEACKDLFIPMDVDEVSVEHQTGNLDDVACLIKASISCEYKPRTLSDIRQELEALHLIITSAEIATFEGRLKNVLVMTSCNKGLGEDPEVKQILAKSVHCTLKSSLYKFSSPQSTSSNKRQRISLFDSPLSSSSAHPL